MFRCNQKSNQFDHQIKLLLVGGESNFKVWLTSSVGTFSFFNSSNHLSSFYFLRKNKFIETPLHWLSFHCSPPKRSKLANTAYLVWMPLPDFGCFINMTQSVLICNILTTNRTWVQRENWETPKKREIHSSARLEKKRKQTEVSSCEMFAETFIFFFFCG